MHAKVELIGVTLPQCAAEVGLGRNSRAIEVLVRGVVFLIFICIMFALELMAAEVWRREVWPRTASAHLEPVFAVQAACEEVEDHPESRD